MDGMIGDIRGVAESMFLSGNMAYLAMVIVAVLIGVATMKNVGQILCTSVLAMIALGVIWLIYNGVTSEAPTAPATYVGEVQTGWDTLAQTSGATLVGYLVTFAVAIIVLFIGKSLIFRN